MKTGDESHVNSIPLTFVNEFRHLCTGGRSSAQCPILRADKIIERADSWSLWDKAEAGDDRSNILQKRGLT